MVGWHHWLNAHEFEQAPGDGEAQGSLACSSPSDHKKSRTLLSDWTTKVSKNFVLIAHFYLFLLWISRLYELWQISYMILMLWIWWVCFIANIWLITVNAPCRNKNNVPSSELYSISVILLLCSTYANEIKPFHIFFLSFPIQCMYSIYFLHISLLSSIKLSFVFNPSR